MLRSGFMGSENETRRENQRTTGRPVGIHAQAHCRTGEGRTERFRTEGAVRETFEAIQWNLADAALR